MKRIDYFKYFIFILNNTVSALIYIGLLLYSGLANADISVDFECTVPASSSFNCNMLKQRFFHEKAIPFIKEHGTVENPSQNLKVTIGRLPVLNGYNFEISISEQGKPKNSSIQINRFLSDAINPVSALEEINSELQKGVLVFSKQSGEAATKDGSATMTYRDYTASQTTPGSSNEVDPGKWTLQPSVGFNFNKLSDVPASINASGGADFNYSGDRNRYLAWTGGSYSRSSVPVLVGSTQELVGLNLYTGGAGSIAILGLDSKNHFNFISSISLQSAPINNINFAMRSGAGVEYNAHPFLTPDSNSFAVGCTLSTNYYSFDRPNLLEKKHMLGLLQNCSATSSLLLDKERGSVISGNLGQSWYVNEPDYVGLSANLSATLKVTERLALRPNLSVFWQTKSITTASPNSAPDLSGLSPEKIAEEQTKFATQAASGSSLGYSGNMNISYTLGEGVNRASQDQRGNSIR